MSNTINITKCDNQLVLFAVNTAGDKSFEICNIKSGNSNNVDLTIQIEEGAFSGTYTPTGGVSGPLTGSQTVNLPADEYSLVYVGINWGGVWAFDLTINDSQPYTDSGTSDVGAVWNLGELNIPFTVKETATA